MLHSSLSCLSLTINSSFIFLLRHTFISFTFPGHPLSNRRLHPFKAAFYRRWMLTCDCGSWCWRTRRPPPWACPVWWWWTGCCRGAHWCGAAANAQLYDPWVAPHLRKRGGEVRSIKTGEDTQLLPLWCIRHNLTCILQTFLLFHHETVTLLYSYLRPISSSSGSPGWVHVSLSTAVELLWLDTALSYLLHYFSPDSVPIDCNGIILHISTYCGQGCGNKHLRCCCPRISTCRQDQENGKRVGRQWEGGIQGDRTNYKVCQHKKTWEGWKMDW